MTNKNKFTKIVIDNIKNIINDHLPDLLEESCNEFIYDMIDEEANERVNKKLDEVSKVHGIPLDLLLRESDDVTICKGTKIKDGVTHRCSFKAVDSGYCKFHKVQGDKIKKRDLSSVNSHTHGPEQMFVRGCPACESKNKLIDLCPYIK